MDVDVNVMVKVKPGRMFPSLVKVALGKGVGEKKRRANASWVNARSRGVGVADCLATTITSSRGSILPPAIIKGKPNARTQMPIKVIMTIALCAFIKLFLLS